MSSKELWEKVENGALKQLHTAWTRRYVSRKPDKDGYYGVVEEYVGRYGEGYILDRPSWDSTTYCYRTYFVYN